MIKIIKTGTVTTYDNDRTSPTVEGAFATIEWELAGGRVSFDYLAGNSCVGIAFDDMAGHQHREVVPLAELRSFCASFLASDEAEVSDGE